ncbi:DivIVA domain-containing protein [Kribbella sp. NPDC058245]|uniref:DivIVA domain-containing protein n=1 Tax=Kribbella sp. NPDC058245 TaxID=3346399 RepID=UPI0036E0010D
MWFFGLIVVLLIGAVAVVASGRWGAMSPAYDDRPDMTVPARQALTSTEIESVRFAVGLRGYRMDEVDTLLERVAREVAERDRRIADLERAVAPILDSPDGDGFASRNRYTAADFDDTGSQEPILVGGDFPPAEQPTAIEEPPAAPALTPAPATAPATAPAPAPVAAAPGVALPAVAVPVAQSPAEPQPPADSAPAVDEPAAEAAPQPQAVAEQAPTAESSPATAANEYERLQAEARALLEATTGSLPTIRTTDKPATPAAPPQAPDARATPAAQPPADSWFQEQPAPPAPQQFQGQDQSGAAYPQPTQQSPAQPSPYQQPPAQPSPYQQPPSQPTPYQQPAQAPQQQPAPVPHWVQPQVAPEQANGGAEAPPEAWEPPSGDPGAQGRHSAPPEQPAYRRPS